MTILRRNSAVDEYQFDDCRLVIPRREIWRDGNRVDAEPKVFDLLLFLIRNRDRAVDKNELQDEVWSGTIVTEASVTRCIMKARRAIGDDDSKSSAIATVRGFGYRFTHDVVEVTEAPREPTIGVTDKPSLVVLPFENLSSDPEQEYFSDGITEDIITELSRFRSLFVIGRQSAFSFKGRNLPTRQIAAEVGVAYVVDGSLRRSGDRVRITVRLVNAVNDSQLWAERYDRQLEDILLVQEEVAKTVAATIGGRVEATRGRQRIEGAALESYDITLKAQALYYDFSKESNTEARELLERAVKIDPENARALAILAAVHSMDSWSFWSDNNKRSQELSLQFGRRSIELDDTDSLAHALFGEILYDCGEADLAEHHFRKAIDLNPSDIAARALYAAKLRSTGQIDEAIEHITIAKRLDPYSLSWIPLVEGSVMFAAKRYAESANALLSMMSPPNEARYLLIAALGQLGRIDDAKRVRLELFSQAKREMPRFPGERLADWEPLLERMYSPGNAADMEHVLDSLRLSGWK